MNRPSWIGLIDRWPAIQKWNRDYLIETSKDAIFEAGGGIVNDPDFSRDQVAASTCSFLQGLLSVFLSVQTTMQNFFEYADCNSDEAPLFIFDSKFADTVPDFQRDYEVPELFKDDLFAIIPDRPNYRFARMESILQLESHVLCSQTRRTVRFLVLLVCLFSLIIRWLLVGNKFSGSKWHVDPNRTHAWNGVIKGPSAARVKIGFLSLDIILIGP